MVNGSSTPVPESTISMNNRLRFAARIVDGCLDSSESLSGILANQESMASACAQAGPLIEGLSRVFDCATLSREVKHGRRDRHDRLDESAFDWDPSFPFVEKLAVELKKAYVPSRVLKTDDPKRFSVMITHDVDRTTTLEPFSIGNALLYRLGLRKSGWWRVRTALSPRSLLGVFHRLIEFELSQEIGAHYFMLSGPYGVGKGGSRTCAKWKSARRLAELIKLAGMKIGLHGSYEACKGDLYKEEKERLEQVLQIRVRTHRNHYLRFEPLRLYGQLERAQIEYDFSVGFASRMGFRSGIARMHPTFDLETNRESKVMAIPLVFMDTLLEREDANELLLRLRRILCEVRQVNGCVSILFHPEAFLIESKAWQFFERVVGMCKELGADLSGDLPAIPPTLH